MTNQPKEEGAKADCCQGYYVNGAHAGNVYYRIEGWGLNSPEREAEIKKRLAGFIAEIKVF